MCLVPLEKSSGNRRRLGHITKQGNTLGIFSYYDYQNLRFLLQVFRREGQKNNSVLVLADNDSHGRVTLTKIKPICERLSVSTLALDVGKSIEDYCILKDRLLDAAVATLQTAFQAEGLTLPPNLAGDVRKSWDANANSQQKENAGKWFKTYSKSLLNDEPASWPATMFF